VTQGVDKPHARGIPQQFEHFGDGIDGASRQQPRRNVCKRQNVGRMGRLAGIFTDGAEGLGFRDDSHYS
jgi:hypothetical protein